MMRVASDCSVDAGSIRNTNDVIPTNEETISERIKNFGSNFSPLGTVGYACWNRD
jgi:hypothetical protein